MARTVWYEQQELNLPSAEEYSTPALPGAARMFISEFFSDILLLHKTVKKTTKRRKNVVRGGKHAFGVATIF